jgi:hypothetical protein
VIDGGDVDVLVVRREAHGHGRAGLKRNAVDNLDFGFIEHQNGVGICRKIQGARAAGDRE